MREWRDRFNSNFTDSPLALALLAPACDGAEDAALERMLNFSWKCNKVTFYDRLGLFVSLRFTAPFVRRPARQPFVKLIFSLTEKKKIREKIFRLVLG